MNLFPILESMGVERMRERGDEITGLCPMHVQRTGKVDRHPSWGINQTTGLHHCFSCGYRGNLVSLHIDVLGVPPDEEVMDQILADSLFAGAPTERYDDEEVPEDELEEIWSPGENLVPMPHRMLARRHITEESAALYDVQWDTERRCWFIPIVDPYGELLGAQYKQAGSQLNLPMDVPKSKTLFGLRQSAASSHVVVVESPLDVVRLHSAGIPAVATFGASVSMEQVRLLARGFDEVIEAMDNDSAGRSAADFLSRELGRLSVPVLHFSYASFPDAKDPGDVEDDEALRRAYRAAWDQLVGLW